MDNSNEAEKYYDDIVCDSEGSADVAYRLLHERLHRRLNNVYQQMGGQRLGELDDTIDDFYLYLYDGEGGNHFHSLTTLRNKASFFTWIVRSYRNFLTVAQREGQLLILNFDPVEEIENAAQAKDEQISYLATAIAYADQTCEAENRFLLYRWLLSFLDKSLALRCEEVCNIIDMSPIAYRVRTSRQHSRILAYIQLQGNGAEIPLDVQHCIIRDEIIDGFERLYPVLLRYYEQSIAQHPKYIAIQKLRQQYDFRLHEKESLTDLWQAITGN